MSATSSFYESGHSRPSSTSTPATGRPLSKRRRVDLAKAISVSNDVELSDSDFDLSDRDFDFGDQDETNSGEQGDESFGSTHSSQMYSFSNTSTPGGSLPSSLRSTNGSVNEAAEPSDYFKDLIQRQNLLIMEMLKKQESLNGALEEVKTDLKETRSNVSLLFEEQKKKTSDSSSKLKRKYPSSLTVRLCMFEGGDFY